MNSAVNIESLSDGELLRRTGELAVRGRRIDAALIGHMAEVDRRKLYLGEACSSMFAYATERLRLSESQAYERITVARRSRVFPALLEMIADGRLTLTAGSKLGPHLTSENAAGLLERAVHATRRQVEALVAEISPKADVPSSIRKLPAPRPAAAEEVRPALTDPHVFQPFTWSSTDVATRSCASAATSIARVMRLASRPRRTSPPRTNTERTRRRRSVFAWCS